VEVRRGPLPARAAVLAARGEPKGEFTLVVAGAGPGEAPREADDDALRGALAKAIAGGQSRRDAAAEVARAFHVPRNRVYRLSLDAGRRREA
jgi:16S rRNA (cytidine1402-2'-O)-methyltransferase